MDKKLRKSPKNARYKSDSSRDPLPLRFHQGFDLQLVELDDLLLLATDPTDEGDDAELPRLQNVVHGTLDGEMRGSRSHHRRIDPGVQCGDAATTQSCCRSLSFVRSVLVVQRRVASKFGRNPGSMTCGKCRNLQCLSVGWVS